MDTVVIVSAVRTAVGRIGGVFKNILPEELSRIVMEEALQKAHLAKDAVDEIIWGQTKQSSDAANIARVAGLMAGFPEEVPAYTVHRQCASSMQAILNGALQIMAGYADVVLAGGVESMSNAPYYLRNARYGYNAGNAELIDANTESQPRSQPQSKYGYITMGLTAENLAEKYGITREEQDRFSLQSQERAIAAIDGGKFHEEITGVPVRKGKETYMEKTDEHPRRETTMEKLAKLAPVFKENGTVTAGNSSGRNDGAAALLLMTEAKCKALQTKPIARVAGAGISGVDPRIMGIGPVTAVQKALQKTGLKLGDIGLIELNEAFAAQSLACIQALGLDESIVNVNGGAIAMGHPLGASGARISVTLLHEMIRKNIRYGLATMCVGGGQGMAVIYENIAAN